MSFSRDEHNPPDYFVRVLLSKGYLFKATFSRNKAKQTTKNYAIVNLEKGIFRFL